MAFPKTRRSTTSKPRRATKRSRFPKAPKAPKAAAPARRSSKSLDVGNRTLSEWSVKDDKLVLAALGIGKCALTTGGLVELAGVLARDPLCVLRRMAQPEITEKLDAKGLGLPEGLDDEERLEFWGLALSGVPLRAAMAWCRGAEDRLSAQDLSAAMTRADLRPALRLVPCLGLMLSCAEQLDALEGLALQPLPVLAKAVEAVLARFDVPTPRAVSQELSGVSEANARAYDWRPERESLSDLAQALKAANFGSAAAKPASSSSYVTSRRSSTSTKKSTGRKRWGKRSSQKSPSVSSGSSSRVDTRTAAEKAWELRESW